MRRILLKYPLCNLKQEHKIQRAKQLEKEAGEQEIQRAKGWSYSIDQEIDDERV